MLKLGYPSAPAAHRDFSQTALTNILFALLACSDTKTLRKLKNETISLSSQVSELIRAYNLLRASRSVSYALIKKNPRALWRWLRLVEPLDHVGLPPDAQSAARR
jgi:hypothetical protein